jgi:hypothetical protein
MQNRRPKQVSCRGRQCITSGLLAGLLCLGFASRLTAEEFFDIEVGFESSGEKEGPVVAIVTFFARRDDVHINEQPAPRLRLAAEQGVLAYDPPKQPPQPADPANPKYLDLSQPVRFEMSWAEGAPSGVQAVPATLTYFYCSSREHWCRRGHIAIEIPVQVPGE